MTRNEIKTKLVDLILVEKYQRTDSNRLETICRSQVNRLSYTMVLGDDCIYLQRGDKKVFIESPSEKKAKRFDGYGRIAHETAFKEAQKILEKLRSWYEEAVCLDKQTA